MNLSKNFPHKYAGEKKRITFSTFSAGSGCVLVRIKAELISSRHDLKFSSLKSKNLFYGIHLGCFSLLCLLLLNSQHHLSESHPWGTLCSSFGACYFPLMVLILTACKKGRRGKNSLILIHGGYWRGGAAGGSFLEWWDTTEWCTQPLNKSTQGNTRSTAQGKCNRGGYWRKVLDRVVVGLG